jgi:NADPH:quinone reductase-like Zn-dependent oxidoreductase
LNDHAILVDGATKGNKGIYVEKQKRWNSVRRGMKVKTLIAQIDVDYRNLVNDLIVAGKLKPVIGGSYPLDRLADAHRFHLPI